MTHKSLDMLALHVSRAKLYPQGRPTAVDRIRVHLTEQPNADLYRPFGSKL